MSTSPPSSHSLPSAPWNFSSSPTVGGVPWTPTIAKGPWLQLYLDSFASEAALLAMIRRAAILQLPGVLFHAGPRGILRRSARCVSFAEGEGVHYGFALGLDGKQDNDGTNLTVEEKADCFADVMDRHPAAAFGLANAESPWDSDAGPEDDMDEAGALRFSRRLRVRLPQAVLGDQPWFAIDSHGEERKVAKPIDQGGTFAGFPSDEFATGLDFRAPQVYFRNFGPSDPVAYQRVVKWHERDWAKHDASLERLGLARPRTYTLQAYGHKSRPQDFVHALLRLRDRASVLWWDNEYASQWPVTDACLRAVARILASVDITPEMTPCDAVVHWQRRLGFPPPERDGSCGWKTIDGAGIMARP